MELLSIIQHHRLKVAVFDFDGTLSTLRQGWESIMEPLMIEMIAGPAPIDKELIREVKEYIDQSTGIQTIYQMKWLLETIKKYGKNPDIKDDPWWYKAEYNRRLMEPVNRRKESILRGEAAREKYLVNGSESFLKALRDRNVEIFAASGTDHSDVVKEAEVLGLKDYFLEIAGAPEGKAECSKEAVLRKLIFQNGLKGPEVIVIGDGKVEIKLGREVGAMTLGVASDEEKGFVVNPVKRERLVKAGAHAIVGDFGDLDRILAWLE